MEIKHENVQNPDTNASTGARTCVHKKETEREREGGKEKERGQVDPCLVSRAQITLQIDGSNTHKSKPKERSQVGCNQKGRKEGAWLTTLSQMQRSKGFIRIE